MRSRPNVKLLLNPGVASPGTELLAEAEVSATSEETPVDFVSLHLSGVIKTGVGVGKHRRTFETTFYEREWKSGPMKLSESRAERRFPTKFLLPENSPASYAGPDASVSYTMKVHVSIPWWPDRKAFFDVPVTLLPAPPPDPQPMTFATSHEGPRGTQPFMELALDATQIACGDVVSGSVSIQNLGDRRVRGIELAFVEMETVTLPRYDVREGKRFKIRVHDGAPVEGAAIPFRVRLPESATITFPRGGSLSPISVATHIEVCADVAWGSNVVVRAPVLVVAKASAPRAERGWVAPVGRERQMLVWQNAAAKLGLVVATKQVGGSTPSPEEEEEHRDSPEQRMTGQRGAVTIEIGAEHRDNDFWLLAKLGWPNLGLDLDVSERKWTDALSVDVVPTGDQYIDDRLCAHVREHAQAKAVVTPDVLRTVMAFEEVKIDDVGARLALRGAPHVPEKLEPFLQNVFAVASAFDAAIQAIPAPVLFAADVPAWQSLASRLRGRLELGRMWIHDAQVGTNAVEIGSVWSRKGLHLGSTLHVAIDPPLEKPPTELEDPSLSPAARDAWRELIAKSKGVEIESNGITVEIEGKLADPQVVMPVVELAVALRRSLGGTIAAGPFR